MCPASIGWAADSCRRPSRSRAATRFNPVSIHANDMEESLRFYAEIFGMERVPRPDFDLHVEWLRLGQQQLHLFKRDTPAPEFHHLALDVDDFEAAYLKPKELGL